MKPYDVEQYWGKADRVSVNALGERVEYRSGVVTTYSLTDNCLAEIGFTRRCINLTISCIEIFMPPKLERLRALLDIDNQVYEDVGFIVFKNLGVTLTGFLDPDDSDMAVTAFVAGRWDEDCDNMKLFDRCKLK